MSYLLKANAVSREQVIAAIYETMLQPQLCDRFLCVGDGALVGDGPAAGGLDLGVRGDVAMTLRTDPGLQSHFTRATDILEQQWVRAGRPGPEAFAGRGGGIWFLISPTGKVVRSSRLAEQAMGAAPSLTELRLAPAALARLKDKVARLKPGCVLGVEPLVLQSEDPGRRYLCRCVGADAGRQARRWLMIEALDFHWDTGAGALIGATFGLGDPELGLLRGMMWGESLADIAAACGLGEAGLRQQVQGILAKTGAPGQAEMLRLFAYLIAEAQHDRSIKQGRVDAPTGVLRVPGLPQMEYLRFGASTGQPVIYFHGIMEGSTGAQWLHPEFRQRGYRVYAPLRAGYGRSEPLSGPEEAIDVLTDQVAALIAQENLQRPILLGHRNGGTYAHVVACRLRNRVAGAVIVGGVAPVDNLAKRYPLPGRQWLFRAIARNLPSLLPVMVKYRVQPYLLRGDRVEMEARLLVGGQDWNLLKEQGLAALFLRSRQRMLSPGVGGLTADLYWLVRDWGRFIGGSSAPVVYLHGDEDPVTPPGYVQEAMSGRRNVQVRLCRGTGALLIHSRPELVFSALSELD